MRPPSAFDACVAHRTAASFDAGDGSTAVEKWRNPGVNKTKAALRKASASRQAFRTVVELLGEALAGVARALSATGSPAGRLRVK